MRGFPKMQQISAYHAELPQILNSLYTQSKIIVGKYSRKV